MHRPLVLKIALTLLLFSSFALAQRRCDPANLRVKVVYSNSRSARSHTEVELLSASGTLITQRFSDDNGNAEFLAISATAYRIRVRDPLVEDTVSDQIGLECGENRSEMVTAKLKADAEQQIKQQEASEAMVSALDLNVPAGAKKEFEKGAQAMQDNDTANAMKHLQRAIDLYPQYAMAWNHLGVEYMQTNQPDKGKEAFEKAVELNPHYPSALINLAKVRWSEKKPAEVEDLMRKAVSSDPGNVEALAILCNALVVNGKIDEALLNTQKLHAQPLHQQFALVHFIAARALVKQNRDSEAAAQLQFFLQEAPTSPAAPQARQALSQLNTPQQHK
jgi:Tfp pilus assembly protein PilF